MKKMAALFLLALLLVGCVRIEEHTYESPVADFDLLPYLEENHAILGVDFQVEEFRNGRYDLTLIPQDEEWDLRFHYQVTHDEQREYADIVQRGIYAIIDDLGTEKIRLVTWQRLNGEASIELFPMPEQFPTAQESPPAPSVPSEPLLAEPTDLLAFLNANFDIQGVDFEIYGVHFNENINRYDYTLLFVPEDEEWDYRFQGQLNEMENREYAEKIFDYAHQVIVQVPQSLADAHINSIQWQPLDSEREIILLVQDRGLHTLP